MIPYFQLTVIHLGPIPIQAWGLMVALGIITGLSVFSSRVKRHGGDPARVWEMAVPILLSAFLGARIFHVVAYDLGFYLANPAEILKIWHGGMSSLGGFVGAVFGLWYAMWRQKLTWNELVATYLDDGMLSLWLGWGIGRIGCFLIHDHPGTLSHFALAVRYSGGARHDLGLYESIVGFVLFLACLALYPVLSQKRRGLLAGLSVYAYALIRLYLDTLRTIDTRYAGLTPAQWGMITLLIALTGWFVFDRLKQSRGKAA